MKKEKSIVLYQSKWNQIFWLLPNTNQRSSYTRRVELDVDGCSKYLVNKLNGIDVVRDKKGNEVEVKARYSKKNISKIEIKNMLKELSENITIERINTIYDMATKATRNGLTFIQFVKKQNKILFCKIDKDNMAISYRYGKDKKTIYKRTFEEYKKLYRSYKKTLNKKIIVEKYNALQEENFLYDFDKEIDKVINFVCYILKGYQSIFDFQLRDIRQDMFLYCYQRKLGLTENYNNVIKRRNFVFVKLLKKSIKPKKKTWKKDFSFTTYLYHNLKSYILKRINHYLYAVNFPSEVVKQCKDLSMFQSSGFNNNNLTRKKVKNLLNYQNKVNSYFENSNKYLSIDDVLFILSLKEFTTRLSPLQYKIYNYISKSYKLKEISNLLDKSLDQIKYQNQLINSKFKAFMN